MFSLPFLETLTTHLGITALDESVDILSCFITAFIFIFSALLITAKTHVGSPIECWLPQTYSSDWGQFAENYCFLKDTYWYPSNEPMQHIASDHKTRHRLQYYQWSSMYLTIAALVFMLPKFLWKTSQSVTDMPILYFCNTTKEICTETPENRKDKVTEMAKLLLNKITAQHAPFSMSSIRPKVVYCLVKLLYLFIAFIQFVTLAYFIGQKKDILWGWTLARNLLNGITWETTGLFPRLAFCDFTIREMAGNNREETVQCVIGINEFNEKIFMFLWFWLILTFATTLVGNLYTFFSFRKNILVNSLLHSIRHRNEKSKKMEIADFANNFLTTDGQLVLSFIKTQSDVVAQEMAIKLWEMYQSNIVIDKVKQKEMALTSSAKEKDLEIGEN